MKREIINDLIARLLAKYGNGYSLYGSHETEEEGTGFRIEGIPATFSVLSFGDIPEGKIDFQIESFPPGYYLYNGDADLEDFLSLIEEFRKPQDQWPGNGNQMTEQG